ncbi:related to TATA-binding protein-associated-factor [Cephalotrichum gorgonifer]|uniref:TBP-associated factor 6 n=1 Tax=Cephalotrichum gorgonifer TaxID=2041049 RepID=A0AAE8SYV0_9PEZI|nr:related to TATA-binding protein-associated-factor [Cephalotrichum gorgonifer]
MAGTAATTDNIKYLWNPESVKDCAESVGIPTLSDEALRNLTQDVEYRIGQVIIEALRFMRAAGRTTLSVQDVNAAMRVLDVEPLYGYESTRPLRFGEASLGPGQPIFYVEDEEVDFEKLINAPLPKIPRDATLTAHWLGIEGVQPAIPQNPIQSDSRSNELLPKGAGANPALAALAGNDAVAHRPAVKHVISKEMALYFDKIQAAILDDTPDEEVDRLRQAALASVRDDPGIHQLVPYFINFVSDQVTHHLDDVFVLRRMMDLTAALIANTTLFLDPYASPLSAPVLTCLLSRRLGSEDGPEAMKEQYQLREFSASLVGELARRYSASNPLLRPKLTRTCLKHFLDQSKPAPVIYGAICGLAAAGGPEAVRLIALKTIKSVSDAVLQPLYNKSESRLDFEMLAGGIVSAILLISKDSLPLATSSAANGAVSEAERAELIEFLGEIIGRRVAELENPQLVRKILEVRLTAD